MTAFDCVIEALLPVAVISLRGPLDPVSVRQLRHTVNTCLAEQPTAVVIDLCGVTACDRNALSVFTAFGTGAAGLCDCPISLAASGPAIVASLDLLGVGSLLPVYPDRTQALAAAAQGAVPRRRSCHLDPTPYATRTARRLVLEACQAWGVPDLAEPAEVIITELVSNVVVHARTRMRVMAALREPVMHLSVRDRSPTPPRRLLPDPETGEGGRGLILVEAMATEWGVTSTENGKIVWATLRARSGRAAAGTPETPEAAEAAGVGEANAGGAAILNFPRRPDSPRRGIDDGSPPPGGAGR